MYIYLFINYSGHEAPSLKIHCLKKYIFPFADFALWMLIGLWPDDTFFVVSRTV